MVRRCYYRLFTGLLAGLYQISDLPRLDNVNPPSPGVRKLPRISVNRSTGGEIKSVNRTGAGEISNLGNWCE